MAEEKECLSWLWRGCLMIIAFVMIVGGLLMLATISRCSRPSRIVAPALRRQTATAPSQPAAPSKIQTPSGRNLKVGPIYDDTGIPDIGQIRQGTHGRVFVEWKVLPGQQYAVRVISEPPARGHWYWGVVNSPARSIAEVIAQVKESHPLLNGQKEWVKNSGIVAVYSESGSSDRAFKVQFFRY